MDSVIALIDEALNEHKHHTLVDANTFRDVLLDIRQLATRPVTDLIDDEFLTIVEGYEA